MRIMMEPKEPVHVRVRYNGNQVFDQVLEPGTKHDIDVEHPKCCGVATLFFVEEDGSEIPVGQANYGECKGDCKGEPTSGCGSNCGSCGCQ